MEAGSGGRFWPQASACSSEDVVSPVSSDGAPASMTALPRNPWLKQPLLFLVASCQVQHHSCNDRQATWGGSYAYYRAETLSGPCNVLSHTRLWSQSAVMWPHLAAGRAVEGFYLHDIRILMVIRFYIAKEEAASGCRETTGNLCHRMHGMWSLLQCRHFPSVTWDRRSNLSAPQRHYQTHTVPLQRGGYTDQTINCPTLY